MNNCPYCGKPAANYYNSITCGGMECKRKHRSVLDKKRYIYAPKVKCDNCGELFAKRRDSKTGKYFCSKHECNLVSRREYYKWRRLQQPSPAFLEDDKFKRLINGKSVYCPTCKYNANCRDRVKILIPVCCEKWTSTEIEWYNNSDNKKQIDFLLEEARTI